MSRRGPISLVVAALLLGGACASHQTRMQRALDASMERAYLTGLYLQTVAGISGTPSRLTRNDGVVYLSDVAPQMLFLAEAGDTARYRSLRAFVADKMVRRLATGVVPGRRYRADLRFEDAPAPTRRVLGRALIAGWERLGDTTSAQLVAQFAPATDDGATLEPVDALVSECDEALDVVGSDPAPARAVLGKARGVLASARQVPTGPTAGSRLGGDSELKAQACLARAAIAVNDPDAAVRHLDRMLDLLKPIVRNAGRPDLSTSADVLRTLSAVRAAGPTSYLPPGTVARP
ncbi:MAG: hypothetical protein HYV19_09125 [Gemmatimonadetes bacterium]|nr:hypothetical protein [Gemmatimonadota bacterium]